MRFPPTGRQRQPDSPGPGQGDFPDDQPGPIPTHLPSNAPGQTPADPIPPIMSLGAEIKYLGERMGFLMQKSIHRPKTFLVKKRVSTRYVFLHRQKILRDSIKDPALYIYAPPLCEEARGRARGLSKSDDDMWGMRWSLLQIVRRHEPVGAKEPRKGARESRGGVRYARDIFGTLGTSA